MCERMYERLFSCTECGGKNYHFVHPSADVDNVVFCSVIQWSEVFRHFTNVCPREQVARGVCVCVVCVVCVCVCVGVLCVCVCVCVLCVSVDVCLHS